jgi:hypothetical protein
VRLSKAQREQVRMMFGGRCAYCGCELGDRWHADHIEPVMRRYRLQHVEGDPRRSLRFVPTGEVWNESANRIDNFFPACVPCNIDKTVYPLEEWRQVLANRIRTLNNTSCYRHAKRFGLVQETGAAIVFYFEKLAAT